MGAYPGQVEQGVAAAGDAVIVRDSYSTVIVPLRVLCRHGMAFGDGRFIP